MTISKKKYPEKARIESRRKRLLNERNLEYSLTVSHPEQESIPIKPAEDGSKLIRLVELESTPINQPIHSEERITWLNCCYKQLKLYPHMLGEDPDRRPTQSKLQIAKEIVDSDAFKLFLRGKVVLVNCKKQYEVIAVIQFTPLEDLTPDERDEINTVISFLHQAKPFVNTVQSSSRSWGGRMWAIGWQKAMAAYELIGQYRNQQAILEAPNVYNMAMQCSSAASDILG
ncbi:hypothetical protein PCANC_19684 [Puccinia coronata f. sp. avenae]|uniref:Tet-like 2OG-Fe(II) oxygenase domain-containing protein n=1 Tax=Puccinia coronata f. sp. avenae TaxID=200324 RepID=A0A2N5SAZ9_9BASI|nr:hypothetical protein PCANC_19684 [Puccinia coronata f. sp. avenae]